MTVSTLRPNATVANNALRNPAGVNTHHGNLSDNNNTTHVITEGANVSYVTLDFTDLALPAGAIIRGLAVRVRVHRGAVATNLQAQLNFPALGGVPQIITSPIVVNFGVSTEVTMYTGDIALTDADVDGMTIRLGPTISGEVWIQEVYLDVTYAVKPTVDVTAPTGTVVDDDTPTIVWTSVLDAGGGPQERYQVNVFNAAAYGAGGFNPGNTGAATWTEAAYTDGATVNQAIPTTRLPNGTYRAYVSVAQLINGVLHWSDWAYEQFIVNVPSPAVPTMTLTPQPNDGRMAILLDANAGATTTTYFRIEARYEDEWVDLRTLMGGGLVDAAPDQVTVYDYDGRNGANVDYRVAAIHDFGGELGTSSSLYDEEPGQWSSPEWWLKHPTNPALNMGVILRSQPGSSRPSRRTVYDPLGREDPVVVSDVRMSSRGTVVFRMPNDAERAALDAILDDNVPLLLQAPAGIVDWPDRWCSFGDVNRDRVVDSSWFPYTFDTLEWVEVARPVSALIG